MLVLHISYKVSIAALRVALLFLLLIRFLHLLAVRYDVRGVFFFLLRDGYGAGRKPLKQRVLGQSAKQHFRVEDTVQHGDD